MRLLTAFGMSNRNGDALRSKCRSGPTTPRHHCLPRSGAQASTLFLLQLSKHCMSCKAGQGAERGGGPSMHVLTFLQDSRVCHFYACLVTDKLTHS